MNTEAITFKELTYIINTLKSHEAPGPDNVPNEACKELNEVNLLELLHMLNQWWNREHIPEEALKAKVILIFKKCDAEHLENHRPISLLNTCYNVFL